MNKTLLFGAASVLSVLLAAPTLAQSSASSEASSAVSSASSELSSAVSSASSEASSMMSSEPSSEPAKDNYGSLISALQSGKLTVDLTTITETTVVNIVTVTSLKASGNSNALDNALDKNKTAIDKLRIDAGASAVLTTKLTAAGYAATDVVAIVTETDGSVTVYVDDRA